MHIARETAICRNPHNSSNRESCIAGQFGYKHSFYQNVVSTKYHLSLYFPKHVTCLIVAILLMICQVFFCIFCKIVCQCCFMSCMCVCVYTVLLSVIMNVESEHPV